ncbi:acetyl xylan esterase, partial [Kouleothrix aurantiaca]
MAFFDLSLDQLRAYTPPRDEPADFDAFWRDTLADAERTPLDARFEPFDSGMRLVETFDVTFSGYGGQPIRGWLVLPRARSGPLPCVVEY